MKTEIKEITPDLAFEMLKSNTLNRPLKKSLIEYYASQMKSGQWRLTGQGISISDANELIDGQHRLAAIVKSKTTQKMLIIHNLDFHEVYS